MPRKLLGELASPTQIIQLPRQRRSLDATPLGDGHPVIVAPGLLTTDRATWLLRRFLESRGYDVDGWGLGRNVGSLDQFDRFVEVVADRAATAGRRVSLVGWSLGGIASRYAAADVPVAVRQIVTLGSPFHADPSSKAIFPAYAALSGVRREDFTPERLAAMSDTPAVPTTSIASVDDALVSLDEAFQPPGPTAETIRIRGSHSGLPSSATVWRIVADRLAQPEGRWQPYAPDRSV